MLVNLADVNSDRIADPDSIIIARTAMYSRKALYEEYFTENGSVPTEQDLIEFAMEFAECDLACDWGHICNRDDLFVLNLSEET